MNNKPNLRERVLNVFSPSRADEAYKKRVKSEREDKAKEDVKKFLAATGYGNHGASKTINSMVGWLVGGGAAEDDIDLHGALLRQRSRDLYAGGGLARSGINALTTNIVGWGIQPKPKIDGDMLGLTDEAREEWERNTLREFKLWADNAMCDAERSKDFWTIQQLAFRSELMSGDCFVLFGMSENKRTPYQTTLRLLEADRVSTPDGTEGESESKETETGGRIVDGVEIDAEGVVTSYYIANRHPLLENTSTLIEWTQIPAYGNDTGLPNILHLMTYERPEQRRGIPFVASQIEQIKQLDRYINSELAANVVAAMLTAFIESDKDDGISGIEDAINEDDKVSDDELNIELAPGAIYSLPPGKKVNTINPIRSNNGFEAFVTALETIIGASMEIPKEVLIKKYDSNYTAARSALLDFWKTVRVYRTQFNARFNQPVYEQWLSEAVALGRIEAPGFFEDPAIRQAWCGCMWMGTSMGHVDPLKEINAAEKRIGLNLSTEEQEASEYNGGDWASIIRQRKKEIDARNEMYGTTNTETEQDEQPEEQPEEEPEEEPEEQPEETEQEERKEGEEDGE